MNAVAFLVALFLNVLLAEDTCYTVPRFPGGNYTVCNPVELNPNVLWAADVENITQWFILQGASADEVYVIDNRLITWSEPESNLGAVQYNVRIYDMFGSDLSNNEFPNITYIKYTIDGIRQFRIMARGGNKVPVFFCIFITYQNSPPQNIGNITVLMKIAPLTLSLPSNQSLTSVIEPGGWSFAMWNWGPLAYKNKLLSFLQANIDCGGGNIKKTPIPISLVNCQFIRMCQYPETNERMVSIIDNNATYQLSYPNIRYYDDINNFVIIGINNNQTSTCRVTINTYPQETVILNFEGMSTNLTTQSVTLLPQRYRQFQIMVPGTNSFLTNETVYVRLIPKNNSKVNSKLVLFYHEYPYDTQQNMIDAQMNVTQSDPNQILETQFLAFSPWQPFSIYNLGTEPGEFYLEVSKKGTYNIINQVWFWCVIGFCIFFLIILLSVAFYAYYRRRSGSYETIR